ncbi:hypothetical protein INT47_000331 [Mucor saturninus]|uniref:Uncharacterized protein n=1 Tax=Mucor saturninus TaxID=64648 RepID=A0A8H7QYM1_9FUNG|nr:hypothetical protein INT47_000331 [Mucor saturninus]
MENSKPMKDQNAAATCQYFSKYCEMYINNVSVPTGKKVKSFHKTFPQLLVCMFGAPSKRGWIQTEMTPIQNKAIRDLLSVNGQFFQALIKLSAYPEYSFDIITDALPADVKKVLSIGSVHLLPKVYSNSTYIVSSSNSNATDIRATATRQATLLPSVMGGDRKIRFTMLQFYLYYFLSAPTWPPLSASSPTPATTTTATTNTFNSQIPRTPTSAYNAPKTPTYGTSTYGTIRPTTSTATAPGQYLSPGVTQAIKLGVYSSLLDEYLQRMITIQPSDTSFPPFINSFLFDACMELWIRTTWIATNGKVNNDLMHYITVFVQYIVKHDIKQCFMDEKLVLTRVYNDMKTELFMLISRLAFNWSKHDDYLNVLDLWSIWAAPWKLGATPRSSDNTEYNPITSGWSKFVLDNLPLYFFLVDVFLQRTSTFTYKEPLPSTTATATTTTSSAYTTPITTSNFVENFTLSGQLRILCRINNLLKAKGLVEFLGLTEQALKQLKASAYSFTSDPFKQLAWHVYNTDTMDKVVRQKISDTYKFLVALDGINGIWNPKGLYAKNMAYRSDALLKTLNGMNTAASIFEAKGWGKQTASKLNKYAAQLKETSSNLHKTFKISNSLHQIVPESLDPTSKKPVVNTPPPAPTEKLMGKPVEKEAIKEAIIGPRCVGSGALLTQEEIRAVREGRAICSYDNIPAVGIRAKNYIRSYEIAPLVRWSIKTDAKINEHVKFCFDEYK